MVIAEAARPNSRSRRWPGWGTIGGYLVISLICMAVLPMLLSVLLTRVPLAGYRAVILTGGSMEPALDTGALVISRQTETEALKPGDIITFRYPNAEPTVTHRIIAVREEDGQRWFTVKGDANATADPEEVSFEEAGAYKTVFAVPYAGRALAFATGGLGIVLLVVLPILGLAALEFVGGQKGRRRAENPQ